jgi:hypothetical protein
MQSFDFYDTLFVRLAGRPTDIFRVMEERVASPHFALRRIAAELGARRVAGSTEVTLEGIYGQPELQGVDIAEAMALEVELERQLISPVAAILQRLAPGDIIVSDMYLPASVMRSILSRHLPGAALPTVIVSSETGHTKSQGTQWRLLKSRFPALRAHTGDNLRSDVAQPRRHGFDATHARETDFNRYERSWLRRDDLDSSLIAGVSRAARLDVPPPILSAQDHDVDSTFASVVAPVLVAFVEHVLDDSRARGIDKVAFLARDGQLLLRIAEKLVRHRSLPLHPFYLYGSRHALHLPGFVDVDRAESWLLEDTTSLSLADIAERGDLPLQLLEDAGRKFGYRDLRADIPRRHRAGLRDVLREPAIAAALRDSAASKWTDCHGYYAAAGLKPGERVALVDVGWSGRMQASLRSVLDRAGAAPVELVGHYLCLSTKTVASAHDSVHGFLHDPDRDQGGCPFDKYRGLIESALMADHATTTGFRNASGEFVPAFGPEVSQEMVKTAARQQSAVLRFVDLLLRLESARGIPIRWPKDMVSKHLRWMLETPTPANARAFAARSHFEGQGDRQKRDLLVELPFGPQLLRWRALGLWPEGTYQLSGAGWLLFAMKGARKLKALLSTARATIRQERR